MDASHNPVLVGVESSTNSQGFALRRSPVLKSPAYTHQEYVNNCIPKKYPVEEMNKQFQFNLRA